jgi:hypothetical protein
MTSCDRCGAGIPANGVAYHVWIWVVARVNAELSGGPWSGIREAMDDVVHRRACLPEPMVASDVHCRRSFIVCPSCKEHLLANPLGRSWNRGPASADSA